MTSPERHPAPEALPDIADMDFAFILPENVEDQRLRTLYEVLVTRMRRETAYVPHTTVQLLLIERIAYNYIVLKVKEAAAGTERGFAHATAQKEFNTFWLTMLQEYNRQTRGTDADFRNNMLAAMTKVVNSVIEAMPDPGQRKVMRQRLADALETSGI